MKIDLSCSLLLIHRALNTNLCRAIGDSRSEARRAFQCTVKTDFFINALVPLLPQEKALNETVRSQGRVKIGLRILQRIVREADPYKKHPNRSSPQQTEETLKLSLP